MTLGGGILIAKVAGFFLINRTHVITFSSVTAKLNCHASTLEMQPHGLD
jgi:hypothetical protein